MRGPQTSPATLPSLHSPVELQSSCEAGQRWSVCLSVSLTSISLAWGECETSPPPLRPGWHEGGRGERSGRRAALSQHLQQLKEQVEGGWTCSSVTLRLGQSQRTPRCADSPRSGSPTTAELAEQTPSQSWSPRSSGTAAAEEPGQRTGAGGLFRLVSQDGSSQRTRCD